MPRQAVTAALAASAVIVGCEYASPRVEFVNRLPTDQPVRNMAFRGALVPASLGPGERSPSRECIRGRSRAYYQIFTVPDGGAPAWRSRQTRVEYEALAGETVRIELTADNDEADLSAPGPFGH